MVEIYIQTCWSDEWICALEIPLEDIRRLSLRPLKWLRFVAFAVLGAKGQLVDKNTNIVDYETDSSDHLDDSYFYFVLDRHYHLADRLGLAYVPGRSTENSPSTVSRPAFRHSVRQRDNDGCVITNTPASECEVARIIPHSKGDQYIRFVISDRGSLYEDQHLDSDIEISWTENGMCLRPDLHKLFDRGKCAFLKTPNFALNPDDIPTVGSGGTPASRTTMQYLQPASPNASDSVPPRDVRVDWFAPRTQAPPSILLDYMYGVAAIRLWASDGIKELMDVHHNIYPSKISYKPIPSIPGGNDGVELGNPTDTEQIPSTSCHTIHHGSNESQLSQAVDRAFAFAMFIRGYPPGTTFTMFHQRQKEEAEKRSHQVAQEKVQRWLEATRASGSTHDTKC